MKALIISFCLYGLDGNFSFVMIHDEQFCPVFFLGSDEHSHSLFISTKNGRIL